MVALWQIRVHTACFREGLNDVVPIQLLQIFNFKELQTLISGTEEPIDIKDWRKHTSYGSKSLRLALTCRMPCG